ncbi:MAG: DinB family protein [Rhodocyclaceae bacterium]|jgi:uncharacterized damage-inducible protein DinB|nr:DinB family protein [Rhodocyclaceae bacterium]
MEWKAYFLRQLDYQLWANQVLFDALAHLEPEALSQPEGLFFGTIHHTVDHLLAVHELWTGRLRGDAPRTPRLDLQRIHHPDWHALKRALQQALHAFRHWLEAQPLEFFSGRCHYTGLGGEPRQDGTADLLTHLMHHFTHHRGQISAVATRLGAPAPEMDFLGFMRAMEGAAREIQAAQMQQ